MTTVTPEPGIPAHASRWDSLVWPRWLPVQARLPLIAQITGAVALTALITAPWWSSIPEPAPALEPSAAAPRPSAVPLRPTVPQSPALAPSSPALPGPETSARPAHLNLDVRHSFGSVDFSVAVDGKPALAGKLAGGGKRFRAFGKRSERGYTRTLDLTPGVHVIRVRVLSTDDQFDQTRVERFDLGSASVATLRVSADKSGLSLVAERPPAPPPAPLTAPVQTPVQASVPAPVAVPAAAAAVPVTAPAASRTAQEANAVVDLLQSVRSILIAIAGFVASAATGFVVQEYLRSRRGLLFTGDEGEAAAAPPKERRRRRRPGEPPPPSDSDSEGDEPGGEPSRLRAE